MATVLERRPEPRTEAEMPIRLARLLNIPISLRNALFLLRVGMGGLFFLSGITKFTEGFSATGFLTRSAGPFSGIYQGLAAYSGFFAVFIPWTEVLLGLALITGTMVRPAALLGAIEVLLFYLAVLPPAQGWINSQIIYILAFVVLIFSGAGYFLGLDYFGIRQERAKRRLRYFLG